MTNYILRDKSSDTATGKNSNILFGGTTSSGQKYSSVTPQKNKDGKLPELVLAKNANAGKELYDRNYSIEIDNHLYS